MTSGPERCLYGCPGPCRRYVNGWMCGEHAPRSNPTPDPYLTAEAFRLGIRQEDGVSWDEARAKALRKLGAHAPPLPAMQGVVRAAAEREAALAQVSASTPQEWTEKARRAVWWLACNRPEFTADDVWMLLDEWEVPRPVEPRALGPILMRALRKGAIEDTGRMTPSVRRHATKMTVYRKAT